jgi:RNA polymerase sigma factor (sigma-70 family)
MRTKSGSQGGGGPARPSFEEVYEGNFDYVWWLLEYLRVHESVSEDATQEVFVIVLRRLPQYEPRDKLRGWLGSIAANVARKFRQREERSMETPEAQPDAQDEAFDLEKEVASAEEVRRVLQEVDPDLCFVFVQHDLTEVPIAEVAKHLGIHENTAKTRLRLARKAVKAAWLRHKARERRTDERSNVVPIVGPLSFMEAARQIPEVPEAQARVWARLQEHIRRGGGPDGPESGPGSSAPPLVTPEPRAALASPAGIAAGAILTLAAGVVIGAVWDPRHRPSRGATLTPAPTSIPIVVASAEAQPAPLPAAVATETPAPSAAPTPSTNERIDLDSVLVDRAETALRAKQVDRALASVQEHAARFHGGGKRAHDREVVWIAALIQAGRMDEARKRLARFEALFPASPRLEGFRRALGAP